jgi:16S rRNA (cytosine1402-N4)-methyltransferase
MVQEMLHATQPRTAGVYLDGTLGAGGYAEAILQASCPDSIVVGLDLDPQAICRAQKRLDKYGDRFRAIHGGFHHTRSILEAQGITAIDGAVLDLGLSSDQLESPERGFSFRLLGPLDMRFDNTSGDTALSYLEVISTNKLEEILATYGEERYYKKLARGIHHESRRGNLSTTEDLVRVVTRLLGRRRGKIHPATRTFQALRIAVNGEMENLKAGLDQIPESLGPGARLCVVSYHSLEDRQVKLSFRERGKIREKWKILTPKPLKPTADEVRLNSRARSASMRVLECLGGQIQGP